MEGAGPRCDASTAAIGLVFRIHDTLHGPPRRPDERVTEAVLDGVGLSVDGLLEKDTINAKIIAA